MKKQITIDLDLTEEQILEFISNESTNNYSMFKIADKALSEVSWHNNMPKSSKLYYIAMLQKHINAFLKDIDYNNDLNVL